MTRAKEKVEATQRPWQAEWDDINHSEIEEGWCVNADGESICMMDGPEDVNQANAELIVRAVNSYDELLAALQALTDAAIYVTREDADMGDTIDGSLIDAARDAIAKATDK